MWDLIVSVPVHCLSFYFGIENENYSLYLNFIDKTYLFTFVLYSIVGFKAN